MIDNFFCQQYGIQLQARCETCAAARKSRLIAEDYFARTHSEAADSYGKEGREGSKYTMATLTEWTPEPGLNPLLYQYRCPQGHLTYLENRIRNSGRHIAKKKVQA